MNTGDDQSWFTDWFRNDTAKRIDDVLKNSGLHNFMQKNGAELENHIFLTAKSEEEYINYVKRLIGRLEEMNASNRAQMACQLMQSATSTYWYKSGMTDMDSKFEELVQKLAVHVEDIGSKLPESAVAESDFEVLMKKINSLVADVAEIKKVVCQSQVDIASLKNDVEKLKHAVSTGVTLPSGDRPPVNTLSLMVKAIKDDTCINVVHFRIRSNQLFKKLMKAYCDQMNIELTTIQFIYNNKVIQDTESPLLLGMKNFDIILAEPSRTHQ